ncbi:hypothetical protein BD410DRAFT_785929 [Rickenella mellea]|uniref:WW domain-containing protein n=1 Tax=Rickenella mellea TaxID=50990 RepID=A0A4Y7Q9X6_9AGAM|nr:hypothetical protein BD410DRAFT_785929 [Rickenella mellea]
MEDDNEQLDWGNEEDEQAGDYARSREYYEDEGGNGRAANADDTDDVVSLGGEEDDIQELVAFQSRSKQDTNGDSPGKVLSKTKGMPPPNSLRREGSDTSQPQQNSPSRSAARRSDSSPRLKRSHSKRDVLVTHALPPKPAVAPAPPGPFRATAQMSLMEASTMANPMVRTQDKEKRRVNGSPSKSISSSDDLGPLPPDWEVRRPRNQDTAGQVYYFNIRTEVSQWTRPVEGGNAASPHSPRREKDSPRIHRRASLSQSLDGGRRSPSPHGSESNSFTEKRPGRSGSVDASSPDHAHDVRPDDHSQPYAHRHRLDTSYSAESVGESPKVFRGDRDRNLSRPEVNRDRPARPRRESPPSPHWRDSQKAPHQAQNDGPWNNNNHRRTSFGQSAELNGTQKPRHHRNEDTRVDTAPRGKGYDREGVPRSSTVRRDRQRSPPPHLREDNVASSGPGYSAAAPSGPTIPEYRSRTQGESKDFGNSFDRQSSASWHHSTQSSKDASVQQQSYEHPPRRPREPEPISRNSSENDAKRRRTDRNPDSAMARRPHSIEDNIPSPLLPVRDEPSPNTFHAAEEDEHRPPRRRQPLPPQSARFKEMASDLPPPPLPPAGRRNSPVLPRGPRDGGTDRRTTNTNPSIPSGPRQSMPTRPSLDIKPNDSGYSRRPLDGNSFGNRQDGRRQSDVGAAKSGRDTDRNVDDSMDIDTSPSSRYPPKARYGETSARNNEGMYTDREDLEERDPVPRGPRAMSSRSQPPTPQNTFPPTQLSTSNFLADTPPHGSKLPPIGPDQGWRGKGRDRSPPPHMTSKRSTRWGNARNVAAEHDDRDRESAPESQHRRDNMSRTGTVDNAPAHRPPPYSREHPYPEDNVQPNTNRQSSVQAISDVSTSLPSRNEPQGRRQQNNWPPRRDAGHPSSQQQQVKGTGGNDIPIPPRRPWPAAEPAEDLSLSSGSAPPHGRDQHPSSAARGWGRSFSGNGNGDMQGAERDVPPSTMGFRSDMMEPSQNTESRQRTQSFPGRRFNDRDRQEEPPVRESTQESKPIGALTNLQRQSSFRAPSEPTQRVSRFSQPVKPVQQQQSHQVSDAGGGEPRTWHPREQAPPDEDIGVNENPRHAQRAHSPPPYSNESSTSLPASHRSHDAERSRTVTGELPRARSAERSPPRTELPVVHASLPPRPRFDSQVSADDHHPNFRGRGGGPANRHPPRAAMRDPSPPPHAQFRDNNHHGRQRGGGRNSRFGGSAKEDWQKDAEARDNEGSGQLNDYETQQQTANNPVLKVHPSRMRMINSNSMPPPPQLPLPQVSQPSHLFSRNDADSAQSSGPIRIRRPSTKFSDTDFQAPEPEPDVTFHGRTNDRGRRRDDRKGFNAPNRDPSSTLPAPPRQYDNRPPQNEEHSPRDRPVSSLLERLNMNPNMMPSPSAPPPLRDRVTSSWVAPEDGGGMGGDGVNHMRGIEENEGFGNHPYRGQRRRGKPRRGRGRGGNQFDA